MEPQRAAAERNVLDLLGERIRRYFPTPDIDHPSIWVDTVFACLRGAIRSGDKTAISIACELIEKDPKLPFGELIKSGLARELKRRPEDMVALERGQVIGASIRLLGMEFAPRELEDYAKLLKKLPRDEYLPQLLLVIPRNDKVRHLLSGLLPAP